MKSVNISTLKHDLCIGCGLCAVVCPNASIKMTYNENKTFIPEIDQATCKDCGLCVSYCPNAYETIKDNLESLRERNSLFFGLENARTYLAYDKSEKRILSASGGAISLIAKKMLETGRVSAVIHAEMARAPIGEPHYRASISRTSEEIDVKRSSFYAPIEFSGVLNAYRKRDESLLVIGTPCVIRGMRKLFTEHPAYMNNSVIFIGLPCSHNVTGHFVDALAESEKIPWNVPFFCNLRDKQGIPDANNFNTVMWDGQTEYFRGNRFRSNFTLMWRNYFFAQNACFYCNDFWGAQADLSAKDAWGKWSSDPLGKNILIIRNENLLGFLDEINTLVMTPLSLHEVINSQLDTIFYKQMGAYYRFFQKVSKETRYSLYLKQKKVRIQSVNCYREKGIAGLVTLIRKEKRRAENKFLALFGNLKERKISKRMRDRVKDHLEIAVLGGYGYKNVGDEAQLNADLEDLKAAFPSALIRVLTPDEKYTYSEHNGVLVQEAPRTAIYNSNNNPIYGFIKQKETRGLKYKSVNTVFKFLFILKSVLIYMNSFLIKNSLPTFFLPVRSSAFMFALKKADIVYFSGGGYLTGKTLSRLWEGALISRIAKNWGKTVVLSGHTFGVWGSTWNKRIAKWGFSRADLFTVRDPIDSVKALREVGIDEKRGFCVCDDALFCRMNNDKRFISGITGFDVDQQYIAVNIHYWGIANQEGKNRLLKMMGVILERAVSLTPCKILFVPMVPSDEETINDFLQRYPNPVYTTVNHKYDFRIVRALYAFSHLTITMKHHPIIFSLGESVPVIALSQSDYYVHKNKGALSLFEQEEFNYNIDNAGEEESIIKSVEIILNNRVEIVKNITRIKEDISLNRKSFFLLLKNYVEQ